MNTRMNCEQDTIEKVKAGDTHAYASLVQKYYPRVKAYITSRLIASHQVEDLTQEAFLVAWNRIDTYSGRGEFGSWLVGIAHILVHNHWRRQKNQQQGLERLKLKAEVHDKLFDLPANDIQSLQKNETLNRLYQCIEKLPSSTQSVVKARYFDKEQIKSIAARLGKNANAITKLLLRAKNQLRICLEKGPNYAH